MVAFCSTIVVVAAVAVLLFGSLYPNLLPSTLDPAWSVTIYNGSSTPYTLKIMTWASLTLLPLVIGYQAWTYWVFRKRITADAIPASVGLSRRPSAEHARRRRPAAVAGLDGDAPLPGCHHVLRGGDRGRTIASAVMLATSSRGVITDPGAPLGGRTGGAALDPVGAVGHSHAGAVAAGPAAPSAAPAR